MDIDTINTKDKPVLIFGSYGWSGEAQNILINIAKSLQLQPYEKNIHIRFAPSNEQLEEVKKIAKEFALSVLNK
jgi:flavorubredoxin